MSLLQSGAQVECAAPNDSLLLTINVTMTHIAYLWNYIHYEKEVVPQILMYLRTFRLMWKT